MVGGWWLVVGGGGDSRTGLVTSLFVLTLTDPRTCGQVPGTKKVTFSGAASISLGLALIVFFVDMLT